MIPLLDSNSRAMQEFEWLFTLGEPGSNATLLTLYESNFIKQDCFLMFKLNVLRQSSSPGDDVKEEEGDSTCDFGQQRRKRQLKRMAD